MFKSLQRLFNNVKKQWNKVVGQAASVLGVKRQAQIPNPKSDNITAVDTSHLLYRKFFARIGNKTTLSQRDAEIIAAEVMGELMAYKKQFKSNMFVAAVDDATSWRHEYSRKKKLPPYKVSRKKQFKKRKQMEAFNTLRTSFIAQLTAMEGITVIGGKGLEADDIIASIVRTKRTQDVLNIVTLDQDLRFLMKTQGVNVFNMQDLSRMTDENLDEDLEERILRGRPAYNVKSVFSRLRDSTYQKIASGELSLSEAFEVLNSNPSSRMQAKTRYKHNQTLLDVTQAPTSIKKRASMAVNAAFKSQPL